MSHKKDTRVYETSYCALEKDGAGHNETLSLNLIGEEPLLLRIDEHPYAVVMRTPGNEIAHAAGLCLSEGIAASPDDFKTIGFDPDLESNIIDIWLTQERRGKVLDILQRRSFVSNTSCGICGKEMVRDIAKAIDPVQDGFQMDLGDVFRCMDKLSESQTYYRTTRGSHAALIIDHDLEAISFAEDVGRHNALDKAIGKAFLNKTLSEAAVLVLSSRISYELVQKASKAGLPVIISNSRPTALAVDIGKILNMTLAFPAKPSGLFIACGQERIKR